MVRRGDRGEDGLTVSTPPNSHMPLAPSSDGPTAAPRLRRRWPWLIACCGLLLVAAVGVGEWLGWPWLAAPLQQSLSQVLGRRVQLVAETGALEGAGVPFQVRFLGSIRLAATRLEIAAPPWSGAAHLVLADDVQLELRYPDLWRAWRGQPLRIARLAAQQLDANLQRDADGRVSWQFGRVDAAGAAPAVKPPLPRFGQLQVVQGRVAYLDAPLLLTLEARLSLAQGAAGTDDAALQVDASGDYRGLPVKLRLTGHGSLSPAAASPDALPAVWPLRLVAAATVGRAALDFRGTVADARAGLGLAGWFRLSGPSLAAVGDPVGITLPTTAAFRAEGLLLRQGADWKVRINSATVGQSRLNGAFVYTKAGTKPLLTGRLGGSRLMLADLGPVVGTTPVALAADAASAATAAKPPPLPRAARPAGAKLLPDRPFDLAALRAMDANVLIDIHVVDLNTRWLEPLQPLRGHLQLNAGLLTLQDLEARTAQGQVRGGLQLDGRGATALLNTDLRWDGVQLAQWIQQTRAAGKPPYVTGRLSGRAVLTGQGRSTAQILASLKGNSLALLHQGTVSHLGIEAAGLDLGQALGLLLVGDDALPVNCAVADLVANQGVIRPRVLVVDTRDSTVWIDGSLSLATEALDLRAVVSPKDISPLALRTPLRVRGSFAAPQVSLEPGPLGRKLAASLLLALVNPLAGLIPLIDLGDGDAPRPALAACQRLLRQHAAGPTVPEPARRIP